MNDIKWEVETVHQNYLTVEQYQHKIVNGLKNGQLKKFTCVVPDRRSSQFCFRLRKKRWFEHKVKYIKIPKDAKWSTTTFLLSFDL